MLTGKELLDFVNANADMDDTTLAEEAGYVRTTKTGKDQVQIKKFYAALLAAKGTTLKTGRSTEKAAKYCTTVHRSGVVLVGRIYAEELGLQPGDQLSISVEKNGIFLEKTGETVELAAPRKKAAAKAPVAEAAEAAQELALAA